MPEKSVPPYAYVWSHVRVMLSALARSNQCKTLFLVCLGIVVVVSANTVAQIRLNAWNRPFYDAVAQKEFALFINQLLVFAVLASSLLVLGVMQTWLQEYLKVSLREALTRDLISEWLKPMRVYRLPLAGDIGINPDQRIHEDIRHMTELLTDLMVGLLQASLLLISFVGVLWVLSGEMAQSDSTSLVAVPGYMVWCALAYALIGSWLSWYVGRPLIDLNVERSARDAELRFALVRVNEAAEAISLFRGEEDERRMLNGELERVIAVMKQLVNGFVRLTWVTSGYGWLAIVIPFIVAAPGYFTGQLSFGALMMTVAAFQQVQQALRWFVDNFQKLADWRAALLRVMLLREALTSLDTLGEKIEHIAISKGANAKLVFDNLGVFLVNGRAALKEPHVEISAGEHVLILGQASAGKTTFFRALAGLWPWGTGSVTLPKGRGIMFMPQRPYLPRGSLCSVLAYPALAKDFEASACIAALDRVGLGHLKPDLDKEARWDIALTLEEQQRLAFARLLLQRPSWVFFDEAISALDEDRRRLILSIFEHELAGSTVISTSARPSTDRFYTRVLNLVRGREGRLALRAHEPLPAGR
ncbi:ABC transporter ATP-binding protein/permease [Microvirga terricola]|uniref:ABC transporter ATP-binding protein/permease n=1 Tax=Microvirga terricola TaxID=2719797 RepID=A0ABX0VDG0_9HYPH|nr:ABC transporter ATP-binding protein/permease [Microvirga terricola]NIX77538.1 ABC transporter ATP-binding protein/permease [Microvirga terricola]